MQSNKLKQGDGLAELRRWQRVRNLDVRPPQGEEENAMYP